MEKVNRKPTLLALRRQYTDPHTLYNRIRALEGLYYDETSRSWLITKHQTICTILDDPRFLANLHSASQVSERYFSSVNKQMLFMDGEKHRRIQQVLLRPLAQITRSMPETIRGFARTALRALKGANEMDVVSAFAAPISLFTIAHILGIPTDDVALLRQLEAYSDTFGDVTSGFFHSDVQDIQHLERYFHQLIAEKRRQPTNDLLSTCIAAHDVFPEEDDLIANCMMLFAAGRITSKKLLGNSVALLLEHWEYYQQMTQADAHFSHLLGEELLRMITPTRYLIREAAEDVWLENSHIQRGQHVLLFLEGANYDPNQFLSPAQFHPQRRPNKHIAFGYGPHQCPGATLARIEIQVALEELLNISRLSPQPGVQPIWNTNPNLGGYSTHTVAIHW